MKTVLDMSDAVRQMMVDLGLNGSFDVHYQRSRSTGWVGEPSGDDVEVVVTIKPLPPMEPGP